MSETEEHACAGVVHSTSPAPPKPSSIQASLLAATCAVLDKLNRGVVIIDASAAVLFANRAARAMLHGQNTITIDSVGRIAFLPPHAASALPAFLQGGCNEGGGGSLVLRIRRHQNDGHYRVLVSRLSVGQTGGNPWFCVLIYEPGGRQRPLPQAVLRDLYGLTPAESRLVNSLFTGSSLKEAAKSLGVSELTARTTLRHVFAKCEVSGQTELMLLLSLGPRTA